MLVDRHHTQYLIELGTLASGKSAAQLGPERDRLEAFLGTLAAAATPQAVLTFEARMRDASKDDAPWSAVRVPAVTPGVPTPAPAAASLILGAHDDDPDGEEDGNRLPPRETPGWTALYDALEQWNTPTILAWIGPLGWQAPHTSLALPQDAELAGPSTAPPPTIGAAASQAAEEAAGRSKQTLRMVGTAAALGGASALLLGLGRALAR